MERKNAWSCCSPEDLKKVMALSEDYDEINTRNRGLKNGDELYVLKYAAVPSMLIELGFLTDETERTYMNTAPARYASAIYAGIVDFVENVKPSFPDIEPASESECE